MTAAFFLQLFPEFSEVNALIIQAKLQLAAARMGGPDATIWGASSVPPAPGAVPTPTKADLAQASYAAHLLMTSPVGVSTLLAQPKDGSARTPYLAQFEEIEMAVAGGFVVAGHVV